MPCQKSRSPASYPDWETRLTYESTSSAAWRGVGRRTFSSNAGTILRVIDQPETACALLSIDFSKAFNRMNHWTCLESLAELGALTESLTIIKSFLTGRSMQFKVNATLSTTRWVKGGSPQGTKLGNFLFIATINNIEDKMDAVPPGVPEMREMDEEADQDYYGLRHLAGRIGAVRRFNSGVAIASTPMKGRDNRRGATLHRWIGPRE